VRLIAVVVLLAAVPLAAQAPRDTAAIRAAAEADSGERAIVDRIVVDTAWALVADRRHTIDIPGGKGLTAGTAIVVKRVRLERREEKWVVVAPTKPKP
jgi:hypothetical protein